MVLSVKHLLLMRSLLHICLVFILLASPAFAEEKPGKPAQAEAATVAALVWLGHVDEGDYAKSWETAAEYFRGAVSSEAWSGLMKGVREPLGKVVERKALEPEHHTSLPGAPDGEYYIVTFDTAFEHKEKARETVTMMLDKDGIWRACGYFIK